MMALIAAALILILMPALMLTHQARMRLQAYQRQLRGAIEEAERIHTELVTQSRLEQMIETLGSKLHALGRPRRVGEELYFGDTLIGGDCGIVDEVKAQCGGVVAVFAGDRPVAASVPNPDQSRAIGVTLAPGPAYDRVLGEGLSYHGTAEILGETYLAIYEPILVDGAVAGMIFAGMKITPPANVPASRDETTVTVRALNAVLQAQVDTIHRRLAARREAEDRRRRQDQLYPAYARAA